MAEQTTYNPYSIGADKRIPAQVDRADLINADRRNARAAFPNLMKVVERATGFFGRLEGRFVGLDPDGHRVENLVVAAGSSLTNTLTALLNEAEEASELIQGILSKMDLSRKDVQNVNDWLKTKLDAIVNRYQGSIAASAEELEEFAQAVLSRIDAVKVPIDRLSVLYLAYNYAVQAVQSIAVVGDPPRINGPATFWSVTAANVANGPYQFVIPCAMYARQGIQIYFTNAGATLFQFRSYGKVDDAAWAAAGAIPAQYSIDNLWQYPAGSLVFGAPPIGGAAVFNALIARMQDPTPWHSIAIELIASASAGNTTGVGTYTLQGGTK